MIRAALGQLVDHPQAIRAWRAVLGLLLLVILVLALMPAPPPQADLGWDKLNHLAAFGTLAVVAVLAQAGGAARLALGLLSYGALIELLQTYTPTRSGEWADLLADGIGIALGLPLGFLLARTARQLAVR